MKSSYIGGIFYGGRDILESWIIELGFDGRVLGEGIFNRH